MTTHPSQFPLFVRPQSRAVDVETSRANVNTELLIEASEWVKRIMRDGVERTDEQIYERAAELGYAATEGRLRHGRLALSTGGEIVEVLGRRGKTRHGASARLWRIK